MLFLISLLVISGCSPLGSKFNYGNDVNTNLIPITSELLIDLSNEEKQGNLIDQQAYYKQDVYDYFVGPGDVLNITVWDHPELTIPAGQFRSAGEAGNLVKADGNVFYPYIGNIYVSGLNVEDIRTLITEQLAKFIEDPQVDVSVASYNSQKVFVSGSVKLPIVIPITNTPLTIIDAIAAAGGLTEFADWNSISLTRTTGQSLEVEEINLYELLENGDLNQNRLLKSGDVINVPQNDSLKVFVMGDIAQAQTLRIGRKGLTLAEAINNAGGINETTADRNGIFVLRSSSFDSAQVDVYQLEADVTSRLVLATKFKLKPMDIVYVTSASVSRWNMLIAQIAPTARAIYELDRVNRDYN